LTVVAAAWEELARAGRTESGWHARRIFPDSVVEIHAAIAQPGGVVAVLVDVSAKSIASTVTYPISAGFEIRPEVVAPGPGGSVRLCLVLREARFREVFGVLAEDVAEVVARADVESAGVRALLGQLNTWQRFLKRPGDGTLTEEEQTGLFAELVLLRQMIRRMPARDAIESWKGPSGGAQDFNLARCAIEVKATTALQPAVFRVSNAVQLDETLVARLFLCHLTAIRSDQEGETLPALVESLRGDTCGQDPGALGDLDAHLRDAGYLDVHARFYAELRYVIRAERWFDVAGAFPRIHLSDLRPGIADCAYVVQLTSCLPFQIEKDTALGIFLDDGHE
jgi:hypothetical protein